MNNSNPITPIVLLSGFLGSGKTTLLMKTIEYYKGKNKQVAVIMNELGEVNLDGLMINENIPMAEMLSGCICCTIRGDLGLTIMNLVEHEHPDVILIESTGAANPMELIDGITESSLYEKIYLQLVVIIVDGPHLLALSEKGVGKSFRLMQEQIRCADVILLNKMDRVEPSQLTRLRAIVSDINAAAKLIETIQCDVDPVLLLSETDNTIQKQQNKVYQNDEVNRNAGNHEHHEHHEHHHHDTAEHAHAVTSHTHHSHDHVMVYTHYFHGKVDRERFEQVIRELPQSVYRAKGVLRFTDSPEDCRYLFQYAYREPDYMRITPQKDVPDVLVLIGEHIPREEIKALLDNLEH